MSNFIVESALMTHGLESVSNEEIYAVWSPEWQIAWMEKGVISVGGVERYLEFRDRAKEYKRVNYFNFEKAKEERISGALTASGTMKVCEMMSIPLAITAGIGGLLHGQEFECCNDLRALKTSKVSMVATAFKDLFDSAYTVNRFIISGVEVLAKNKSWTEGYVFPQKTSNSYILKVAYSVDQQEGLDNRQASLRVKINPQTLYLNPIPEKERIADMDILETAVAYGRECERQGKYLHPSVNSKIDQLTQGYSSKIQLESLVKNIRWAQMFEER